MGTNNNECIFKVRFHLGKGKNFMHWRVENTTTSEVIFYNPKEVQLILKGCFLRNQKATATKIHNGANKSVCAWVECEAIEFVLNDFITPNGIQLSYNPKVTPNWILDGKDVDSQTFNKLTSLENKLFSDVVKTEGLLQRELF